MRPGLLRHRRHRRRFRRDFRRDFRRRHAAHLGRGIQHRRGAGGGECGTNKDRLEFFLDGQQVFTFADDGDGPEAWPYDKRHHLILNVAIGGAWGGMKGVDDAIFPQKMLVDYVRYWKRDG